MPHGLGCGKRSALRPRPPKRPACNAAESGEGLADYQDHINARIRFADPDEDDKRRHEEEARVDAEEQELAARRLFNEAYLQRMGRPQAFGLC